MASRFIFAEESAFARPMSGTARTVGSLTRADTLDFHRKTFTPDGAAVIAAGSLSIEAVRDTAEAAFGSWSGPPRPPQSTPVSPRSRNLQVVIVERARAVQSEIRIGHIGVERNTPDFFSILVMNTIL